MAKRVLDDKWLRAFKSEKPQTEIFDSLCPGLSIRVTSAGRKAWSFLFTIPGSDKRARLPLGTFPATSIRDARTAASKAREKVEAGQDPRKEPEADMTMKDLVELRLTMAVRDGRIDRKTGKIAKALDTAEEIARRYQKEIVAVIGDVTLKSMCQPRQGIIYLNKVLDPILKRGRARLAGMVFADMMTLGNFAVGRGEIEYNPFAKADLIGSTGEVGTRALELSEIKTLWNALPVIMPASSLVPSILKLLLLTGQRLGEVCGMKNSEIDLSNRTWFIPAERSKNDYEHLVPLSEPALAIVRAAMKKAPGDYVFPNEKGTAYNTNAVALAIRRTRETTPEAPHGKLGIVEWSAHDLRRTVATRMSSDLKLTDIDIGHVLNHRSTTRKSVTQKRYNKHDFLKEKRAALEKWATLVTKTVAVTVASAHPRLPSPPPQPIGNRRQEVPSAAAQH